MWLLDKNRQGLFFPKSWMEGTRNKKGSNTKITENFKIYKRIIHITLC